MPLLPPSTGVTLVEEYYLIDNWDRSLRKVVECNGRVLLKNKSNNNNIESGGNDLRLLDVKSFILLFEITGILDVNFGRVFFECNVKPKCLLIVLVFPTKKRI